jgi:hypothetical protein
LVLHQSIDPAHRIGCPERSILRPKDQVETMARIGQPPFPDEALTAAVKFCADEPSACSASSPREVGATEFKELVKIGVEGDQSPIICKR